VIGVRAAAFAAVCVSMILLSNAGATRSTKQADVAAAETVGHVVKSDQEWRRILPGESYRVLRQQGTEIPFTGGYWNQHDAGIYRCAGCGLSLFSSKTKFESHTGWPSFWQPIAASHVRVANDTSHMMTRDEVVCARCGGHLGHVFDDGPPPTHLRYCMNSAALRFDKAK
jgi:peptide-methionine (R)-S-oxide reductase